MLPSMPILFTRESQDGFFSKPDPSTSFFSRNPAPTTAITPVLVTPEAEPQTSQTSTSQTETSGKLDTKKKEPPELPEDALETALVRSYYTKVQSRFACNQSVPTNKFVQFRDILKSFDPVKETPVDLYKKLEVLFGDEHKDILEEFLLFLKPGQAADVGRFMDHFVLTQMTSFIKTLQSTFARKPTVLRKVIRALTNAVNSGSSERLKAQVLPHLRSSPRLTLMFKALFPDERPPDSVYESGVDVMEESVLRGDRGYDVWRCGGDADDKRNIDANQKLDTMYLHGRVFLQHGRMLRSARVTFPYSKEPYRAHARRLAPPHCRASPPHSDDDGSPKKNRKIPPKRPNKPRSPTKTTKDVNDNTKHKDCAANPAISSPKTSRKAQNAKSKTVKEKIDYITPKKEKKERNAADQRRDDTTKVKQARTEVAATVDTKEPTVKMKSNTTGSWTREEDKTMLELLKGEAVSELVFVKIKDLLPHRSVSEIKERFCHVMSLLQQMAVGEVT